MNISNMPSIFKVAQVCNDNVLMSGKHGIGKTEVVREFASSNNMHCETLILSLVDESDLQGMPYLEGKTTCFAEPIWLARMKQANKEGKHCVLFLDELNRAPTTIRNASMSLILDRKINEHELPTLNGMKTMVISAINPSDEYDTQDLDIAQVDRFGYYDVEVDVKGWLEWSNGKVNNIVRSFIAENPSKLHFTPEETMDSIGATPRSWTMLGEYINNIDMIPSNLQIGIIASKIGLALGSQFYNFMLTYETVVTVADVEEFISKLEINKDNIHSMALKLKTELIPNVESITQQDLINQMWDKYLLDEGKVRDLTTQKDIMPLLVFYYAIDMEVRTSSLSEKQDKYFESYVKFASLDFEGKPLFTEILKYKRSK
jgi:hypothetical protein